jgi:hypothetical protein
MLADLNRDGFRDAIGTDTKTNELLVFRGSGNGTFQAPVRLAAGLNPTAVATGDLNKDGYLDVVVANSDADTLSVFLGDVAGNLALSVTLTAGDYPSAVVIRNVSGATGDTNLDLIVSNRNSHTVSVLLGNGNGTFQAPATLNISDTTAANPSPVGLVVGDFNYDGRQDIATANSGQDYVSYLLGNGNGTFGAVQTAWVGGKQYGIAARDLNFDGRVDLVVSARAESMSKIAVLKSKTGAASIFPDYDSYYLAGLPAQVELQDYNGDGYPDIWVKHDSDGGVSLLLSSKGAVFQLPASYSTNFTIDTIAVGDVTGDDYPDLVAMGLGGTLSCHSNSRDFLVIASNNPYSNTLDETKSYTFPEDVDAIDIIFSVYSKLGAGDTLTVSEAGGDSVTLNSNTAFAVCYYNTGLCGLAVTLNGNKAVFRLLSDAGTTAHGYSIISARRSIDTDADGKSDSNDTDDDNDGLLDTEEDINGNGVVDVGETDAKRADTDGDGLSDYYEKKVTHTDPTKADTDGDGIPDSHDSDPLVSANRNYAPMKSGMTWLLRNQNASGSWGSGEREVLTTAVAIDVLQRNNIRSQQYAKGLSWLANAPDSNNDYIARKIVAQKAAGLDVKPLVKKLLAQRITRSLPYTSGGQQSIMNFDGWGTRDKYDIGFLDTGRAMWALFYAQEPVANIATVYSLILSYQNQDGGWGMSFSRSSDIQSTSSILVPLALQPVYFGNTSYNTNIKSAISWILTQKHADNGFGIGGISTVQDTSEAMKALSVAIEAHNALSASGVTLFNTTELGNINNSLLYASNYLLSRSYLDGSWSNDPYLTAMALSGLTYVNWAWDTDGDGTMDSYDSDRDGDSVPNAQDAFPLDKFESKDTDGDGIGDNADTDIDGDGVANAQDIFKLNPKEWKDTDADGIGDNADTDDDGDGIPDSQEDANLNGVYDLGETNYQAADSDGDGYNDALELNTLGADALNPLVHPNSDYDHDGFTPAQGDWNDTDATLYPGAPEICGDGIDQNGDGIDPPCFAADGNLNGDSIVDVADVILAQRIALGQVVPTTEQHVRADVAPAGHPDGIIDTADVTRILRKALGQENF